MRAERLKAADVALIYKLWNEYAAAIASENAEQWIALWCDDGIQMAPDLPQRSGKGQIRKAIQKKFDQFHTKITINLEVVRILGNQAYTHGSFKSLVSPKEGKDKIKLQTSGKFLTVLEKQLDGDWKILIDCFNYNGLEEKGGVESEM